MNKVYIKVNRCEIGMKMAETIYNDYGAVIVGENTILDQHILRKLNNLGIDKVRIYSDTEDEYISNEAEIFNIQYNVNKY